nr:hypothetical protein [Tanacetum cinerariifolium]
AGPDRGSKRRREGKEPESASPPTETATRSTGRWKSPLDTGAEDKPIVQSSQHLEWFSQQQKPPSPDRAWNKTVPAIHRSIQPWISEIEKQANTRSSFNELMDTPLDFSNFLINRLKVDTLTPELLADQLEWVNPEGQQYPHNLVKPLPLIPNNRGRRVIPFEHFINNDLEYLRGGTSSHDRLKGIRMQYLPQSIWRKSDNDRAAAMIQAIDKRLKARRIMRSLERFFGG